MRDPATAGYAGHIGLWPALDHQPSYRTYAPSPPELCVSVAEGWTLHVPGTPEGVAYLRRLSAVLDHAADHAEYANGTTPIVAIGGAS